MADAPLQHALITGPVTGILTLADGTQVNVTPTVIEVTSLEQAEEISFIIGEHFVEHGHPDDIDTVPIENEDGVVVDQELIQRPFVHEHDPKFDDHPAKYTGEPAGTPIADDEQKG